MARPDPKRKIVYKIEDEVREELGDPQLTRNVVLIHFDDLQHDSYLHEMFPEKQFDKLYINLDGKVPVYMPYRDGFRITLQKDHYTKMYLLHEFAHFLQHNASAHHGKQFCLIYCLLLFRYMSRKHGQTMAKKMRLAGCI